MLRAQWLQRATNEERSVTLLESGRRLELPRGKPPSISNREGVERSKSEKKGLRFHVLAVRFERGDVQ